MRKRFFHSFHIPFESGELYITDSMGDITGGMLFSFLLVYWFKTLCRHRPDLLSSPPDGVLP